MLGRDQVVCQCAPGKCFLDEDAEWAKRNSAQSHSPSGHIKSIQKWRIIDEDRLAAKGQWMSSLQVHGIYQVCCQSKTGNAVSNDLSMLPQNQIT